jgi:hypothetical protein
VGEIQATLAEHGALRILIEYDEHRQPWALAFTLPTRFGLRSFRLPANIAGVRAVLEHQYRQGRIAPRYARPEHAAKVGWRILKDWVSAQVAIIDAGMAAMEEVMLPYLLADDGRTVYQLLEHRQLLLTEGGA